MKNTLEILALASGITTLCPAADTGLRTGGIGYFNTDRSIAAAIAT